MQSKTGFIEANGTQLYYEEAGEGPNLVLVHAGIADHRMWDDQFPVFAQHYHTIRYDLRGFGQSPMTAGPYAHSADLYALMQGLNIDRAYVLGCSMGGETVIEFTLDHPEMVEAVILVGSGVGGYDESDIEIPEIYYEMLAARQQGDLDKLALLEVRFWVAGMGRELEEIDPAVREKVFMMNRLAQNTPPDLGQPLQPEIQPITRLAEIHVPTLVICGDLDDPIIIKIANLLATEIPNAKKVVLTGTAHVPNMERPLEFNQVVLSFLDSVNQKTA